ncbi:hypothetical protein [Thalassomonas haliotis]|uniref:Uncharacterized protein n=1 Tax=Thalassomonas haliotis TaxID=485448 RepID=A0ABY7VA80_9GAMM|nr:hypothetical protein [Thalassomonas haliotis]WDE09807.1 hypothetical protein H3N35_15940 [Thalassomonas haliotis]
MSLCTQQKCCAWYSAGVDSLKWLTVADNVFYVANFANKSPTRVKISPSAEYD